MGLLTNFVRWAIQLLAFLALFQFKDYFTFGYEGFLGLLVGAAFCFIVAWILARIFVAMLSRRREE